MGTKNSVIPISFRVPRKSGADVFQEDIYPDTYAGKAATTSDEWLGGANKDPVLTTMDPNKKTDDDGTAYKFEKKKTYQELDEENKALKERVKELEAKLGISSNDDDAPATEDNEQKEDDAE